MDSHYHPAVFQRLCALAGQSDWQGLVVYLGSLSNAQFRTAGYMLGERILPTLAEREAWAMAETLVRHQPKAFLVTMLKAIGEGLRNRTLHLHTEGARHFLLVVRGNPVDVQKTLLHLLPVPDDPADLQWLFRRLGVEDGEARLSVLLRTATLPAAYLLCQALRFVEHDRSLLVRSAHFLMKRGDGLGFNVASFLCTYYGLDEVKGTFSLRLQPYQLARIESSYEAFCEAMRR